MAQCLLQTKLVLHSILKVIHNDMRMQMTNEQDMIGYEVKIEINFNFNYFFFKLKPMKCKD